ncbi:hypothetical protein BKA64DRAFT_646381 [Cadophora sp. MPI-SDFR-AT-0126]|nr:hypothetical protein BKA64DRAFT_646381 [Leotiomycetes sp. MPI-SDFR-AT-0126]
MDSLEADLDTLLRQTSQNSSVTHTVEVVASMPIPTQKVIVRKIFNESFSAQDRREHLIDVINSLADTEREGLFSDLGNISLGHREKICRGVIGNLEQASQQTVILDTIWGWAEDQRKQFVEIAEYMDLSPALCETQLDAKLEIFQRHLLMARQEWSDRQIARQSRPASQTGQVMTLTSPVSAGPNNDLSGDRTPPTPATGTRRHEIRGALVGDRARVSNDSQGHQEPQDSNAVATRSSTLGDPTRQLRPLQEFLQLNAERLIVTAVDDGEMKWREKSVEFKNASGIDPENLAIGALFRSTEAKTELATMARFLGSYRLANRADSVRNKDELQAMYEEITAVCLDLPLSRVRGCKLVPALPSKSKEDPHKIVGTPPQPGYQLLTVNQIQTHDRWQNERSIGSNIQLLWLQHKHPRGSLLQMGESDALQVPWRAPDSNDCGVLLCHYFIQWAFWKWIDPKVDKFLGRSLRIGFARMLIESAKTFEGQEGVDDDGDVTME